MAENVRSTVQTRRRQEERCAVAIGDDEGRRCGAPPLCCEIANGIQIQRNMLSLLSSLFFHAFCLKKWTKQCRFRLFLGKKLPQCEPAWQVFGQFYTGSEFGSLLIWLCSSSRPGGDPVPSRTGGTGRSGPVFTTMVNSNWSLQFFLVNNWSLQLKPNSAQPLAGLCTKLNGPIRTCNQTRVKPSFYIKKNIILP